MSDEAPHEFHLTREVPFVPGSGLVGLGTTKGAMPQPVLGLVFEAEMQVDQDEIVGYVWLKAVTERSAGMPSKYEYLMFGLDAGGFEPVVSAIAEAVNGRATGRAGIAVAGTYEGYHNSAQFAFDRKVTEESVDGLGASVRTLDGGKGFELALRDAGQRAGHAEYLKSFPGAGAADVAVARLVANLDGEGLSLLLSEFAALKEWERTHRNAMQAHLDARPAAPGMGR